MRNLIYIVTILLLVSCDCYKVATGVVVDKANLMPLSGVKVSFADEPTTFSYTDSLGNYSMNYVKWGFGCYTKENKKVVAEKKNYKTSGEKDGWSTIELELKEKNQ